MACDLLIGRLRALPPAGDAAIKENSALSPPNLAASGGDGWNAMSPRALPERIEAHNHSMDLWECTGCAPQGWETHLQNSLVPIQGEIQLCHGGATPLPSLGLARITQ